VNSGDGIDSFRQSSAYNAPRHVLGSTTARRQSTVEQISPDGQFIAFIKPYKETRNIWVKKTSEPFSAAKLITADTKRPIPGYFWSRDSKYILFVQDQAGDENYNVYAVNPADCPAPGQDAPPARNLAAAKNVRAYIYNVPRRDPDVIHVGLNDRDPAWHDLYKVKISTGERTLVRKNTEKIAGWIFDNQGQLRLAIRTGDNASRLARWSLNWAGFSTSYLLAGSAWPCRELVHRRTGMTPGRRTSVFAFGTVVVVNQPDQIRVRGMSEVDGSQLSSDSLRRK
jgi:hypothetical protein